MSGDVVDAGRYELNRRRCTARRHGAGRVSAGVRRRTDLRGGRLQLPRRLVLAAQRPERAGSCERLRPAAHQSVPNQQNLSHYRTQYAARRLIPCRVNNSNDNISCRHTQQSQSVIQFVNRLPRRRTALNSTTQLYVTNYIETNYITHRLVRALHTRTHTRLTALCPGLPR